MMVCRLLLIAVSLWGQLALAEEPVEFATIPCREIIAVMDATSTDPGPSSAAVLSYSIRSDLPGVAPKDITLQLRAGTTTCDIVVDEHGRFTLTYDQELIDADAVLVSNQPKGSLRVSISTSFDLSAITLDMRNLLTDGRIAYVKLYDAALAKRVAAAEAASAGYLKQLANVSGATSPRNATVRPFTVDPGGSSSHEGKYLLLWPEGKGSGATARLEKNRSSVFADLFSETYPEGFSSLSGQPLLRRDKEGTYCLSCGEQLRARNPDVVLSTKHQWMCALVSLEEL
ncbi:MAG: hypothetical protein ACTHK7_02890 [Aureliella sp.]